MRDDLQHTLTDTFRLGRYRKFHDVRNSTENKRVDEDAPGGKVSIHHHRRNTMVPRKRFGENWSALVGLVEKNVGRRWDTFYSELCKAYDPRNQVNYHIFQHLFGRPVSLEINCKVKRIGKKNVVCTLSRWDKSEYVFNAVTGKHERVVNKCLEDRWVPLWEDTSTVFYVDPRDGILKRNKWHDRAKHRAKIERQKRSTRHDAVLKIINRTAELHLEDGSWFLYELANRPAPVRIFGIPGHSELYFSSLTKEDKAERGVFYMKAGQVVELFPEVKTANYHGSMYYRSRRGASSKLLRKHGLETPYKEPEAALSQREINKYLKAA